MLLYLAERLACHKVIRMAMVGQIPMSQI
uniref:Uncharacterized protein n=1 Tax=Arundo donax TaxID=35708 RepID=A0A0A9ASK4_ARUDO